MMTSRWSLRRTHTHTHTHTHTMSDDDPVVDMSSQQQQHQLALPTVHKELVHEKAVSALEDAISNLIIEYTGVAGARPTMHDVFLAPNAGTDAKNRLHGYVATVDGTAPAEALISDTLGSGITWMRVEGAEDAAELEKKFTATGMMPGMIVSVVSGDEYPSTVQYIVAQGNDQTAAADLAAKVARTRASLDTVLTGSMAKDYVAVLTRSKDARMQALTQFMSTHQLEATGTGSGNITSNFIINVRALSKAAASSRVSGKNVYAAYSGVADPSEAHSGVMVYRGPIAGYVLYTGNVHSAAGKPSVSFTNENSNRPFSIFPIDTGRALKSTSSSRALDRHRDTNERVREAHARRVRWTGKVSSFNPQALSVYHAPNDFHLLSALSRLGVEPGGRINQQILNTLVCEVPALETKNLSLPELVDVAQQSTERTLPVSTTSFLNMLASWPDAASQRLSELFSSQHNDTVDVDTEILKAIHSSSSSG